MDENARSLQHLTSFTINEILEEWRRRLGTSPPKLRSQEVLVRLLAWRLQERELGGFSPNTKTRLRRGAKEDETPNVVRRPRKKTIPGTVLAREWKGTTHHVAVTTRGYEYAGRSYGSLSEIAREITGTRWSGPLFFGLKTASVRKAPQ